MLLIIIITVGSSKMPWYKDVLWTQMSNMSYFPIGWQTGLDEHNDNNNNDDSSIYNNSNNSSNNNSNNNNNNSNSRFQQNAHKSTIICIQMYYLVWRCYLHAFQSSPNPSRRRGPLRLAALPSLCIYIYTHTHSTYTYIYIYVHYMFIYIERESVYIYIYTHYTHIYMYIIRICSWVQGCGVWEW